MNLTPLGIGSCVTLCDHFRIFAVIKTFSNNFFSIFFPISPNYIIKQV